MDEIYLVEYCLLFMAFQSNFYFIGLSVFLVFI